MEEGRKRWKRRKRAGSRRVDKRRWGTGSEEESGRSRESTERKQVGRWKGREGEGGKRRAREEPRTSVGVA